MSWKSWNNRPKNDTFFEDLKNHAKTTFLEGPCANLGPQVRFLTDFGPQLGPQMAPWSTIFDQKGAKRLRPRTPEASWSRPGRDLAPKTVQRRIFLDLGPFLVDFGRIFDEIWRIFKDFPHILDVILVRFGVFIFQGICSKTVKPQPHEARKHNEFTNHKAANPQSIFPTILARRHARTRLNNFRSVQTT